MKNIIIFGQMGAGKTTVAKMICKFAYEKYAYEYKIASLGSEIKEITKKYGQGTRRENQLVGQAFREIFGKDIWNERLFNKISKEQQIVIDDARQLNELCFWENLNFFPVAVIADKEIRAERLKKRDGYQQNIYMEHPTEKSAEYIAQTACKYVIENNGSIEELEQKVKYFLEFLAGEKRCMFA